MPRVWRRRSRIEAVGNGVTANALLLRLYEYGHCPGMPGYPPLQPRTPSAGRSPKAVDLQNSAGLVIHKNQFCRREDYATKGSAAHIPFAGSMLGALACLRLFQFATRGVRHLAAVREGRPWRGERAYHVLPSRYRDEHLEQLRSAASNSK